MATPVPVRLGCVTVRRCEAALSWARLGLRLLEATASGGSRGGGERDGRGRTAGGGERGDGGDDESGTTGEAHVEPLFGVGDRIRRRPVSSSK
ncbi:hypothetical protein GCM10025868_15470 [Angustibacter aerolatus]|uniref:Uncharacterized protein n=1 Tax=Angustibacter aerolatus TaxID=1162965 RepID=A0ABQ6JHC8_9ACTN|nr:hypothetical protein GCM10025868_15470 [Angustibacter aerolatus]